MENKDKCISFELAKEIAMIKGEDLKLPESEYVHEYLINSDSHRLVSRDRSFYAMNGHKFNHKEVKQCNAYDVAELGEILKVIDGSISYGYFHDGTFTVTKRVDDTPGVFSRTQSNKNEAEARGLMFKHLLSIGTFG